MPDPIHGGDERAAELATLRAARAALDAGDADRARRILLERERAVEAEQPDEAAS